MIPERLRIVLPLAIRLLMASRWRKITTVQAMEALTDMPDDQHPLSLQAGPWRAVIWNEDDPDAFKRVPVMPL